MLVKKNLNKYLKHTVSGVFELAKKKMAHKFHSTKIENDEFICLNFQANTSKDDLNNSSKTAQGID